jgi:3-deoxy-D-arabino-heptulosonate 7-phosphate (DAHP) synthase
MAVNVDSSHGTVPGDTVTLSTQEAVVASADGIMEEVHQEGEAVLADRFQSFKREKYLVLLERVQELAANVHGTAHCVEKIESLQ